MGRGGGTMPIRRLLQLSLSPRVTAKANNIKDCGLRCCRCYSCGSDQSNDKLVEKEKPTPASLLPCIVFPPRFYEATVSGGDDSKEPYYMFVNLKSGHDQKVELVVDDKTFPGWERKHLLPGNARCVGSSHGWVVYLNPNTNATLYLFRHPPLFYSSEPWHSQFFRLPPVETLPGVIAVRTLKAAPPAYQYHQYTARYPPPSTAASSPVTHEYVFRGRCSRSATTTKDVAAATDDDDDDEAENGFSSTPEEMAGSVIKKIILSSSPGTGSGKSGCGCIVLALVRSHTLAFCKLGDTQWTPLINEEEEEEEEDGDDDRGRRRFRYHDIIYSKKDGCFYALDGRTGHLESWDLTHPSNPKRTLFEPSSGEAFAQQSQDDKEITTSNYYLVESPSGDLFMLQREIFPGLDYIFDEKKFEIPEDTFTQTKVYYTSTFYVSKLDPTKKQWQPVQGIGDLAFFVGVNHSASVSTLDFPDLVSNSINFSDDHSYQTPDQNSGLGQDMGYFVLGEEAPCSISADHRTFNVIPSPFFVAPF